MYEIDKSQSLFPKRELMVNAYRDKFPFKPIDYSKCKEKKALPHQIDMIKKFNTVLTDVLTNDLKINLRWRIEDILYLNPHEELEKSNKLLSPRYNKFVELLPQELLDRVNEEMLYEFKGKESEKNLLLKSNEVSFKAF